MREVRTSNSHCFGCIHVRYATLSLAVGYLVMHVLGMGLLVYLAINLDELIKAVSVGISTGQVYSQSVAIIQESAPMDEDPYAPILVRNTNITLWVTNFVINSPLTSGVPTRSVLNLAMAFCAINAVVAVLAICGVAKSLPGCLVPFCISQASDLILSIMTAAGLDLNGFAAKEDILASSPTYETGPIEFSDMNWGMQALFVTGQVCKMSVKLYLLLVIWKCMKYMKDENTRHAREDLQGKRAEDFLQGTMMVDASPPPAYQLAPDGEDDAPIHAV